MDCTQAQSAINEAIDHCPVDAAVLEAAKTHCRECPQCGLYVRTLNAVRRAAPPRPPDDLADRIMATIRAEAAAAQGPAVLGEADERTPEEREQTDLVANSESALVVLSDVGDATTQPAEQVLAPQPEIPGATMPHDVARRVSVGSTRMGRRQLVAWGSAAAILLVVVGVSAALRVMQVVSGESTSGAPTDLAQVVAPQVAAPTIAGESAAASASKGADATSMDRSSTASASLYVVFDGGVYVHQGVSPQPKGELSTSGQTRVAFDASTPRATRPVYTGTAADAVYVENDAGELQRFVLVKRTYKDAVYRLRSADIEEYGAWPMIPPGVPLPVPENNADGSPVFALDGNDSAGTPVYRRIGTDSETGIAIAPGTPVNDPAAGNPNWTWWTP